MPEDSRKTYVSTIIANYFGLDVSAVSGLSEHRALGNFLDDANCALLSARRTHRNTIDLSNEVRNE